MNFETQNFRNLRGNRNHGGRCQKSWQIIFSKIYGEIRRNTYSTEEQEIIGNHTDHNGGKVIAGSINLDTIGVSEWNTGDPYHK